MTYLINYDLASPGQNYVFLIRAIRSYGYCGKISRSCWFINTDQSAAQIRDYLRQFIDSDDRLFVCLFSAWASMNIDKETTDKLGI